MPAGMAKKKKKKTFAYYTALGKTETVVSPCDTECFLSLGVSFPSLEVF